MKMIPLIGAIVVALALSAPAAAHSSKAKRGATLEESERHLQRVVSHADYVLAYFRRERPLRRPDCLPPFGGAVILRQPECLIPSRRPELEESLVQHKRLKRAALRDLRAVRRAILARADRTWGEAVAYADRCFPGVAGWLFAVSGDEGGGGLWTWNGGGNVISESTRVRYRALERRFGTYYLLRFRPGSAASDVGGWVQFMPGTFLAYVGDAFGAARARGCALLPEWRSWLSPAGQALTAGYMRWSGRSGGHWSASGH